MPYGTGALLVRDGARLRDAHHVDATYMQDVHADDLIPSFTHYGPELSRDFRGLRVWLPVKLHGLNAFRDALDEKLDLARLVYDELSATPGFELPWEPDLSIVPFRYRFRHGDPDETNRRLLEEINASKRVFLTSTRVGRTIHPARVHPQPSLAPRPRGGVHRDHPARRGDARRLTLS